MKINPNEELLTGASLRNAWKNNVPSNEDFGTILKESIESSPKTEEGPFGLPIINSISGVNCDLICPAGETPVIDGVENLLDILDEYTGKLGDPRVSLEELAPLVDKMEAKKEELVPVLDSLADGDRIKDILNQALIASSLEVMKFKRGDYLNP
jgi:hypothetical protein